jgi:hypothetical protein
MVPFQKDARVISRSLDQQIYDRPGLRAAIDVISEEDMSGRVVRARFEVFIDFGKAVRKQIIPSMNVPDNVEPSRVRHPRTYSAGRISPRY